jgi:hypothetical protein
MADFRSFNRNTRIPAKAMASVIDPAGWTAETLGSTDDFSYAITERGADELAAAVAAFRRRGLPLEVSEVAAAA